MRLRKAWQGTRKAGIHTSGPPCHSMSLAGIRVVPPLEQCPRCHGFVRCPDYLAVCQDQTRSSVLLHQGHGCNPNFQVLDKHLPRPLHRECSSYDRGCGRCLLAPYSESQICNQVLCTLIQILKEVCTDLNGKLKKLLLTNNDCKECPTAHS